MIRRLVFGAAAIALCSIAVPSLFSSSAQAEDESPKLLDAGFSFRGAFRTIDKASAQRGLQIYKEVCSNCHGLYELSYRNVAALGYSEDQVKNFAAQYQVSDLNDEGAVIQRPAKPSDKFVRPFPNERAARAGRWITAPSSF